MHWCIDETLALLAMIPFIGYFFGKLHAWWHRQFMHKCHEKGCYYTHVEHCHMPANIPHGKPGEGQCEQHPLITHDDGPEPENCFEPGWDWLSQDDVEERFGGSIMDDLIGNNQLLKVGVRPADDEFNWFVNDKQELKAVFKNRVFIHGYEQREWDEVINDTGSCYQGLA